MQLGRLRESANKRQSCTTCGAGSFIPTELENRVVTGDKATYSRRSFSGRGQRASATAEGFVCGALFVQPGMRQASFHSVQDRTSVVGIHPESVSNNAAS
jgi:hypothetical protein